MVAPTLAAPWTGCGARSELPGVGATSTGSGTTTGHHAPPPDTGGGWVIDRRARLRRMARGARCSTTSAPCLVLGRERERQLGTAPSSIRRSSSPPIPLASPTGIVAMASGLDQTCAVLQDGTLECRGGNGVGESGTGTNGTTVPPTAIGAGFEFVSAGFDYACASRTDGSSTACWGYGRPRASSAAWRSVPSYEPAPTTVAGVTGALNISASEYVTCVRTVEKGVQCWGLGPLGDGTTSDSTSPVDVLGLSGSPCPRWPWAGCTRCALLGEAGAVSLGLRRLRRARSGPRSRLGRGGHGGAGHRAGRGRLAHGGHLVRRVSHVRAAGERDRRSAGGNDSGRPSGLGCRPSPRCTRLAQAKSIASGQSHDCAVLATRQGGLLAGDNGTGQRGHGDGHRGQRRSQCPVVLERLEATLLLSLRRSRCRRSTSGLQTIYVRVADDLRCVVVITRGSRCWPSAES